MNTIRTTAAFFAIAATGACAADAEVRVTDAQTVTDRTPTVGSVGHGFAAEYEVVEIEQVRYHVDDGEVISQDAAWTTGPEGTERFVDTDGVTVAHHRLDDAWIHVDDDMRVELDVSEPGLDEAPVHVDGVSVPMVDGPVSMRFGAGQMLDEHTLQLFAVLRAMKTPVDADVSCSAHTGHTMVCQGDVFDTRDVATRVTIVGVAR